MYPSTPVAVGAPTVGAELENNIWDFNIWDACRSQSSCFVPNVAQTVNQGIIGCSGFEPVTRLPGVFTPSSSTDDIVSHLKAAAWLFSWSGQLQEPLLQNTTVLIWTYPHSFTPHHSSFFGGGGSLHRYVNVHVCSQPTIRPAPLSLQSSSLTGTSSSVDSARWICTGARPPHPPHPPQLHSLNLVLHFHFQSFQCHTSIVPQLDV